MLNDKRHLDSLQREHARFIEKRQLIDEKSHDIHLLLPNINSSDLPNDTLQRLRQEIEHLKERFDETIIEKLKLEQHLLSKNNQNALRSLDEQMIKFETQNEERERRKRQCEREWDLFMDEINLLQDKLNTFKQRKINTQDSIEEQIHFIRMQNQELYQYQDELSHLKQHGQTMCIEDEQIDEKRRQLNILYDKLDHDTPTPYLKHHHDLEKRSNDLEDKIIEQHNILSIFITQRLVVIQPELLHLNDEIENLSKELNVVSLENDIVYVKDNFIRISNDLREKFHRSATVIVNDIKRNLANPQDLLTQCSIQSRTRYDRDINKMKDQLERMMEVEKRLETIGDVYLNTEALIKRLATYYLYDLQSTEAPLGSFHPRIDTLEELNDQFNEFDQTVRTLSDWVQEQTSDPEFMRSRNMEAGVEDNLRKCDEIEYQLTTKQQILTSLKSYRNRI
ncbi:unnamed protein product [Rotaria sordida]|uniref:Uncharacterized protein n=1 Tax=Rotaria sordida TaxID=392033 RepID=A0A815EXM2_9BILA|nr:unnamed protein product [Rotaria sordida]